MKGDNVKFELLEGEDFREKELLKLKLRGSHRGKRGSHRGKTDGVNERIQFRT